MRLAEFKMRLLVFFAGALRKWAGSIEPTAHAPSPSREYREDRLDDGEAGLPTASRRSGAPSGPPEHWARLVATAPPDHWLDLIRAKAPHLLSPEGELIAAERESVSAAADADAPDGPHGGPSDGALETDADLRPGTFAGNSATDEQSTPPQQSRGRRQRTADSSAQVSGAKWLNRLRFRPPKQRPVRDEASEYPDSQATKSAEYGGSAAEVARPAADRESRSGRSDRYEQSRELTSERQHDPNAAASEPAKRVRYPKDDLNETAERRSDREIGATGVAQRGSAVAAGRYGSRDDPKAQPSSAASREAASRITVDDGRQPRASNAELTVFVERPETKSAKAGSRSAANTSQDTERRKQYPRAGELNRELTGDLQNSRDANLAETPNERFSSRGFRRLSADRSVGGNASASGQELPSVRETALRNAGPVAVERSRDARTAISATAHASAPSRAAESATNRDPRNAATREVENPRHRFASTDFATPALTESSESIWPTLPPSRNFEANFQIGDELAALEREAETLRRLDREQRGTLWNA